MDEGAMNIHNDRENIIVRTSILGILVNIFLAAFKAAVGLAAASISLVLDAVNNLTDALSSVITIIGTKLAGKAPNKKHPYGYGRIEYMSQLVVSGIVLYAGITAMVESVKKVLAPETPQYSYVTVILILAAVVVKLLLGFYVKKRGQAVNSGALIASGSDASSDAALSASVLLAALVFMFTGINIEAWVGMVIAAFIIKSGLELIRDGLDEILGQRIDADLSNKVKGVVMTFDEVFGVYDLFLNNYGPDRFIGSLHVEVSGQMLAGEVDSLTREISEKVYLETNVLLTGIGIYAVDNEDEKTVEIRRNVEEIVGRYVGILQFHGFYLNADKKMLSFDIVPEYTAQNHEAIVEKIREEVEKKYPDYLIRITVDTDVSD